MLYEEENPQKRRVMLCQINVYPYPVPIIATQQSCFYRHSVNSAKYLIIELFVIFLLGIELYTKKLKCHVLSNDDKNASR